MLNRVLGCDWLIYWSVLTAHHKTSVMNVWLWLPPIEEKGGIWVTSFLLTSKLSLHIKQYCTFIIFCNMWLDVKPTISHLKINMLMIWCVFWAIERFKIFCNGGLEAFLVDNDMAAWIIVLTYMMKLSWSSSDPVQTVTYKRTDMLMSLHLSQSHIMTCVTSKNILQYT